MSIADRIAWILLAFAAGYLTMHVVVALARGALP